MEAAEKEADSLCLWRIKIFFFKVLGFCFTVALPGAKETGVNGLVIDCWWLCSF